jgi:hypothetical protein
VSHPGPPRTQPGQSPSTIQPAPSGGGNGGGDDSEPWDPGFFYLYDNTSPESSYVPDEPCRVVCLSDPSVQCSSYSGQCSGLPDRLICDGQTVMCPGGAAPNQAAQSDQPCQGQDQGQLQGQAQGQGQVQGQGQGQAQAQAKASLPCSGTGAAAKPAQRCEGRPAAGRPHGQGKAAVSCSGANGVP